jgi:hypothetical protein
MSLNLGSYWLAGGAFSCALCSKVCANYAAAEACRLTHLTPNVVRLPTGAPAKSSCLCPVGSGVVKFGIVRPAQDIT